MFFWLIAKIYNLNFQSPAQRSFEGLAFQKNGDQLWVLYERSFINGLTIKEGAELTFHKDQTGYDELQIKTATKIEPWSDPTTSAKLVGPVEFYENGNVKSATLEQQWKDLASGMELKDEGLVRFHKTGSVESGILSSPYSLPADQSMVLYSGIRQDEPIEFFPSGSLKSGYLQNSWVTPFGFAMAAEDRVEFSPNGSLKTNKVLLESDWLDNKTGVTYKAGKPLIFEPSQNGKIIEGTLALDYIDPGKNILYGAGTLIKFSKKSTTVLGGTLGQAWIDTKDTPPVTYAMGTKIEFNEDGILISYTGSKADDIVGDEYFDKDFTNLVFLVENPSSIYFHPNGRVKYGYVNQVWEDTGIPGGKFNFGPAEFHPNGKLKQVEKLLTPYTHPQFKATFKEKLTFSEAGILTGGILADDWTNPKDNITYKKETQIYLSSKHPGVVSYGEFAYIGNQSPDMSYKGRVFRGVKTVGFSAPGVLTYVFASDDLNYQNVTCHKSNPILFYESGNLKGCRVSGYQVNKSHRVYNINNPGVTVVNPRPSEVLVHLSGASFQKNSRRLTYGSEWAYTGEGKANILKLPYTTEVIFHDQSSPKVKLAQPHHLYNILTINSKNWVSEATAVELYPNGMIHSFVPEKTYLGYLNPTRVWVDSNGNVYKSETEKWNLGSNPIVDQIQKSFSIPKNQ
jgi:hypothetical protein